LKQQRLYKKKEKNQTKQKSIYIPLQFTKKQKKEENTITIQGSLIAMQSNLMAQSKTKKMESLVNRH
jgi:hypothetical protein